MTADGRVIHNRYASLTKQTEIRNRLETLEIDEVSEDVENDNAELETLTELIEELAPMACINYQDDEEKLRFLTTPLSGTKRCLSA